MILYLVGGQRAFGIGNRVLAPYQIAVLRQPFVDIDDLGRRAKAVIGRDQDVGIGTGSLDQTADITVHPAIEIDAKRFQSLGFRPRRAGIAIGIDVAIEQMLQLVGTVQNDGRQFGAVVLHHAAGDLGPGRIAHILQLDPVSMLIGLDAGDAFLLFAYVHAQIAVIEILRRLQLVEQLWRMHPVAQVFPRHKTGNDIAINLRRRRMAVKVQRRGAQFVPVCDRKYRLCPVIAPVIDLEVDRAIVKISRAQKVIDTMHFWAATGGHAGPGGRRQRVVGRHQVCNDPAPHHRGKERQNTHFAKRAQQPEGCPIKPDHQNTIRHLTPRGRPDFRWATMCQRLFVQHVLPNTPMLQLQHQPRINSRIYHSYACAMC